MMVRSLTSTLTAGGALVALLLGGTSVASAQEPDTSCSDATAVAANAQAAVDAKAGELVNLRAALDLALGANDDEEPNTPAEDQAIADAQAAVDAGTSALSDLTADLQAALEVKAEACAPGGEPGGGEPPAEEPPAQNLYDDCADVTAAGAAPLYPSDEGYRAELDTDSDGIACEVEEQTGGGSGGGGFGQTDADDVPVGAADTGGL